MRSISFMIFLFLLSSSCSAQRQVIDKIYEYSYTKEPSVLYNSIDFRTDSTLVISGGRGQYSYGWFPNYKVLNDSTYYVYHPNPRPAEYPITDTIMIKVQMDDVKNDTIYWKNDKEFIFRERLFKLFEYKGVPLEDQ
ncbi:hypothetical protein [uncultured Aquimarina sp.]|uniref:hypothetical protein n=1 Tax=uncultured Aquimarina sp. TaxID=575652 RepID=UPI00263936B9|nr:hypothetical protein [uncultured Aquimarina sp.]